MRIAIVATIKNEEADVLKFLRAIEFQSHKPDLLVLTVAESTDKTMQIVLDWAALTALKTEIDYVDGNRSMGRNLGIQHALRQGAEIVVLTNVCEPLTYWLEILVKPIEDGLADAVGGSWMLDTRSAREDAMGLLTQHSPEQFDETKISALNMAIDAPMFNEIGMFNPELDTSEDTEFVQRLTDGSHWVVVVPDAMVLWRPSTLTLHGAAKANFQFAKTDRKAGLKQGQYLGTLFAYLVIGALTFVAPPLALLTFGAWLAFRIRKILSVDGLVGEIPFAVMAAFVLDWARIIGYAAS